MQSRLPILDCRPIGAQLFGRFTLRRVSLTLVANSFRLQFVGAGVGEKALNWGPAHALPVYLFLMDFRHFAPFSASLWGPGSGHRSRHEPNRRACLAS
jgi:hypothetical protein